MTEGFIPAHGGYKKLLSYQKAEIVYDATVYSCGRFLEKRDRTYDQMIVIFCAPANMRNGQRNIPTLDASENSTGFRMLSMPLSKKVSSTRTLPSAPMSSSG